MSAFNGFSFFLTNAAEATAQGLEADGHIFLTEWLMLHGAAGYNFARYDSYPDGPCPDTPIQESSGDGSCDLGGRRLSGAPRWNTHFGASASSPIFDFGLEGFVSVQANWQSKIYYQSDLDELDSEEAFWFFGLQAGFNHPEGLWQANVIVDNLTDAHIKTSSTDLPAFTTGPHIGTKMPGRSLTFAVSTRF